MKYSVHVTLRMILKVISINLPTFAPGANQGDRASLVH